MRIISVIKIKDGVVDEITSFGIFEEQLSDDVVKPAEKLFIKTAKELGCTADEEEMEDIIGNGYFNIMNSSVCLSWSEI